MLYGFAWDEFCSFYLEMVKSRLGDASSRPAAQRVLAHTLDALLRLLHPMTPFVTEEVWQRLAAAAPARGIDSPRTAAESVMIAPWPESDPRRRNERIEAQFGRFQEVLRAVRETRTRQNVPPRTQIDFAVRCDDATASLLQPMEAYFVSMAAARPLAWGPGVAATALSVSVALPGMEIFVDLSNLIDVEAEAERKKQEVAKLDGMIAAKRKKLENKNFVDRAPPAVVQGERDSLADMESQHAAATAFLQRLGGQGG